METLHERLLKLKQDTGTYTLNPLLDSVDMDIVDKIQADSSAVPYLSEVVSKIHSLLDNVTIGYSDGWAQVFALYNEARMFVHLNGRLVISKVPERPQKTPDFEIAFRQKRYFAELKSLAFAQAPLNYRRVFDEALSKRLETEQAVKAGQKVVVTEQSIDPYCLSSSRFRVYPKLEIIHILIDKILQNYKAGQYEVGDTILIVDLVQLGIPSLPAQTILPFFYDHQEGQVISGDLWNVAFGKVEQLILSYPTAYIYGSVDGCLKKQGILIEFEKVRALAFQIGRDARTTEFVGLYRNKDYETKDLLETFCHYTNDDTNAEGYVLANAASRK